MVRAAALLRGNNSTMRRVDTWDAGCPTGVQLLVSGTEEKTRRFYFLESEDFSSPKSDVGWIFSADRQTFHISRLRVSSVSRCEHRPGFV